ncbi:hypothetical protein [Burkholderia lata]|uniref:hypothetical protein n=1 Tax=Burkholderia lata (strain ATCC 17760 / DSM 23089 / LMG 22485 / NCIMB 9086 / R18194 / 383) TaxID=482957 RepID=UPI0015816239|nr:hypothetical protein [Burkholderia lata]
MRKSYYLTYGTDLSKGEVAKLLESQVGLDFEERDSQYFGVYFQYVGLYADKLTIGDNFVESSGEWLDGKNKCKTLIEVQINSGKNSDKLGKYKYIKSGFDGDKSFFIIKDECIEEDS